MTGQALDVGIGILELVLAGYVIGRLLRSRVGLPWLIAPTGFFFLRGIDRVGAGLFGGTPRAVGLLLDSLVLGVLVVVLFSIDRGLRGLLGSQGRGSTARAGVRTGSPRLPAVCPPSTGDAGHDDRRRSPLPTRARPGGHEAARRAGRDDRGGGRPPRAGVPGSPKRAGGRRAIASSGAVARCRLVAFGLDSE
jgi:hypothetical protein